MQLCSFSFLLLFFSITMSLSAFFQYKSRLVTDSSLQHHLLTPKPHETQSVLVCTHKRACGCAHLCEYLNTRVVAISLPSALIAHLPHAAICICIYICICCKVCFICTGLSSQLSLFSSPAHIFTHTHTVHLVQ